MYIINNCKYPKKNIHFLTLYEGKRQLGTEEKDYKQIFYEKTCINFLQQKLLN